MHTPLITRRYDDLIYQYIQDAQNVVLKSIEVDPIAYPIQFQKQLHEKWEDVSIKLEKVKEGYIELIARDTQFGKTLKNYDFWCKRREAWLVQKKVKIELVRKHMKI